MKKCVKCSVEKELSCFSKGNGKDGLKYNCKDCCKEYNKQYRLNNQYKIKDYNKQYRLNNPDKIKESNKQWVLNNPEYDKAWKLNNTDKIKLIHKRWRLNNSDKLKENSKFYSLNNPHYTFIRSSINRIENNYFVNSSFTKEQLETLLFTKDQFDKHLNKFSYHKDDYHIDHIIPISKFKINKDTSKEVILKINDIRNLMPLTTLQNLLKQNKITFEYVPEWHFKDLSAFIKEMIDLDLLDLKDIIIDV